MIWLCFVSAWFRNVGVFVQVGETQWKTSTLSAAEKILPKHPEHAHTHIICSSVELFSACCQLHFQQVLHWHSPGFPCVAKAGGAKMLQNVILDVLLLPIFSNVWQASTNYFPLHSVLPSICLLLFASPPSSHAWASSGGLDLNK